jgi:outer membrane receptor protein involved in Fe transport
MDGTGLVSRRARGLYVNGLGVFALCMAAAAYGQDRPGDANAQGSQKEPVLEEVLVTGSRIARASSLDAITPVTTVDAQDYKLSGTVNVERLLSETPQFIGSTNGGSQSNVVPGGNAFVNLRGLGPQRNLVLVDGRRFTVQGTDLTTDINTIPQALIERTEVVTGGSSAVYGSDAIAGVVNFIMRKDFQGVQTDAHVDFDSVTKTPDYTTDITVGNNFDDNRGNVVVSMDFLNRGSISRQQVAYARPALTDGCVTPASFSSRGPGTPVPGNPTGQACLNAGGVMGLIAGGSADIPDGRFVPVSSSLLPGGSNTGLNAAYAGAGLAGVGPFGWTFNDAGNTPRAALDPQDRYNNSLLNYLQVPQRRWMINSFAHYEVAPKVTAYTELHFSSNEVTQLLAPSNADGTFLYNDNNPFLSPAMQGLLTQLDAAETGKTCSSLNSAICTTANDGIAALSSGRRFNQVGDRIDVADRVAWRFVGGFRGDLGSLSEHFLTGLSYDAYYMYTQTNETDHESGAVSKSRLQAALLSVGGAPPVCDIFGQQLSSACASTIGITSTNLTKTQMTGGAVSLSGTVADLWAGPIQFALGGEHRYTFAEVDPDFFLSSGDVAGFNPASPTRGHESVSEAFGELRVPLLTHVPVAERLSVNGAFRHSNYDVNGIGGVWTYSAGGDWGITQDVSFRGQHQHAIRAPNVGELFGGQTTSFPVINDPCSSLANSAQQTAAVRAVCIATGVRPADVFTGGIQPNPYIATTSGGNPNLGAEVSDTDTVGVVFTPRFISNFSLTVDWYRIDVTGAIAALSGGVGGVLSNCYYTLQNASSVFCQAIQRDPGTGQIVNVNAGLANAGFLKTEGVDFGARYAHELGWGMLSRTGTLHFSSDWSWETQYTLVPIKDQPNVRYECVGTYGQNICGGGVSSGEPIPALKGVTRITWSDGPVDMSLRYRFIDSVTVDKYLVPLRNGATAPPLNTLTNPVLPKAHYFDLSFTWDINEKLEVSGGVNNLFNWGPPIVGSTQGYGNTWPATYDPYGQTFFFNGRLKL